MADRDRAQGTGPAERDQFIPVRKSEILAALSSHPALTSEQDRELFRQVGRLLASIFHYEYFERLEKLRDAYFYFNPEIDPRGRFDPATLDRSYAELTEAFGAVLKGANFVEVPRAEIEAAHRTHAALHVEVRASEEDFREVRFFRRGRHNELVEVPSWYGWRKRKTTIEVYDDVVLLVAMKQSADLAKKRRQPVRPGAVLIKYFRNIASADLNALYPNVRVVLGWRDRLFLTVPALAGGIPILMNLASTFTVLFVVLGFYLGVRGAVEDDEMKTALAAMSGLIAFGGFMMRQWMRYQRQSLRYQKLLTDNIYFRNVNNNAGIFDYMIGAAEEQETKEAFLAYFFILTADTPPTKPELDRRIEFWVKASFGIEINFEISDALAKLDRLGLLGIDGQRLAVPSPQDCLARLNKLWDEYFRYPAPAQMPTAETRKWPLRPASTGR